MGRTAPVDDREHARSGDVLTAAPPPPRTGLLLPAFTFALFLSAFLMFLVEPMVARMALPVLGGAAMVWNTCVVFFQFALLAGYAAAHGVAMRLPRGWDAVVYVALLVAGFLFLPMLIPLADPPAAGSPVGWLLLRLVRSIGIPFVALAMSASILQRTFSGTRHPSAHDPYFLYVASNAGSVAGLLSYPFVVEPLLRLRDQNRLWTAGYALFTALAAGAIAIARRRGEAEGVAARSVIEHESSGRPIRWLLLALAPSSLTLSVTTSLSTDIASVPLLWILPLLVYLLTFALAFSRRGPALHALANRELPILVVAMVIFMALHLVGAIWLFVPLHLILLAGAGLLCHGALAADRPQASQLTAFYFWIALGGMLGGIFNTLVAPVLFTGIIEYPIALVLACAFRSPLQRDGLVLRQAQDERHTAATARGELVEPRAAHRWTARDLLWPIAVAAVAVPLVAIVRHLGWRDDVAMYVPAFMCFSQSKHPRRFALCAGALLAAPSIAPYTSADVDARLLHAERTFFGVYRVTADASNQYHSLFHGTTLHGMQAVDPSRQDEPLTYYHRTGPFGQAFARLPQLARTPDVAAVGLGIGSLASYAPKDQHWTFYEIDPAVERMARSDAFSYLARCGDRCAVVIGDARLSLARAPQRFGLIVLDAFSSDAIPIHLMTSEALSLYLDRLLPGGVLAFHISNRYLQLSPVLARLAAERHLVALEQIDRVPAGPGDVAKRPSDWIVVAREARDLEPLANDARWTAPAFAPSTPLWTDDFSNILSVMRWK